MNARKLGSSLARKPVPRDIPCMNGRPRGRKRLAETVYRQVPELERGEIIADIRQVALNIGLLWPRLLTFDTYRAHGGRYTFEQTLTLGGFDALRRAA